MKTRKNNVEINSIADLSTTFGSRAVFFVLCAAIILTTLAYGTVHQPSLALFYLSTILVIGFWVWDALAGGMIRLNKSLVQIPLVGAIIYGIIQIIPFGTAGDIAGVSGAARTISWDVNATQNALVQFIALLIYFAAALSFIDKPKRLRSITYTIILFGFVFAFFAVIQYLLSPTKIYGIYEARSAQPFGSFVNRHDFAAFMEMCLALPLGLLFSGAIEREKRLIYLTAIGLMGIALVMSGSRGGLVAFVAEVIFLVIFAGKKSSKKSSRQTVLQIALAVVLIGTIIGGAILIGGESSLTRFAETVGTKDPTSNRTQIWRVTLDVIKSAPVCGVGFGAYGVAYTQFDTLNGAERVEQSHNDYLQILADAGIIGALLGIGFIAALLREGFRQFASVDKFRRGVAIGALAGCFAIFVHSLFDFVLHITAISLLFLTLAALAVLGKQVAEDEEIHDQQRRKKKPATVTPIESNPRFQESINP